MRGRIPALWLALAFLAALPGPAFAQDNPAQDDVGAGLVPAPLVTAIEIRSDAPLEGSLEMESLIEIEVGKPLDGEDVRHTLRNLQAVGIASEVEVYTREDPAAGGVVAMIVFRAVTQVEEVRLEGELGLARDDLLRAIPVRVAEPLSEDSVLQGVYALQDLYERSGWPMPECSSR